MTTSNFPNHLTRDFSPLESDTINIIPALRNGLRVTVTLKIAQQFKLAKIQIVQKGTVKQIQYVKTDLSLWTMELK